MWLYMYLLSVQVKESNAWGAGIGLSQNTYPSFCHGHAKMATNVPAIFKCMLRLITCEQCHLVSEGEAGGGGGRWRETFSYLLYLCVLRPGIDLYHFDKIFPQGRIKQSSLSSVFFSPVPALMLSVNVVLGLTRCGCPCCSLQNSTFE